MHCIRREGVRYNNGSFTRDPSCGKGVIKTMFDKVRKGFVLAALLPASAAMAADGTRDMRPYVSPQVQLIAADDDRNTDRGIGFQVDFGKAITDRYGVELGVFHHSFNADGSVPGQIDWTEFGYRINNLLFFGKGERTLSYASLGVGLAHQEPEGAGFESDEPFADIGLGFFLIDRESDNRNSLRLDSRYRHMFIEDDLYNTSSFGELIVSLGMAFPIGKRPQEVAVAPALPVAAGVADADGDGVADKYDRCPGTPGGVGVDSVGCPLDSDGDGVPDDLDRCPRTPAGVAVDSRGCPLKTAPAAAERRFEDVNFAFDSSAISEYAAVLLDNAAAEIRALQKKFQSVKVQVSGHADSIGTENYNSGLSTRRAIAVRDYLVSRGVKAGSIVTLGFGETQPVASNKTPQGRLLNRRAEIRARAE